MLQVSAWIPFMIANDSERLNPWRIRWDSKKMSRSSNSWWMICINWDHKFVVKHLIFIGINVNNAISHPWLGIVYATDVFTVMTGADGIVLPTLIPFYSHIPLMIFSLLSGYPSIHTYPICIYYIYMYIYIHIYSILFPYSHFMSHFPMIFHVLSRHIPMSEDLDLVKWMVGGIAQRSWYRYQIHSRYM